MHAFWIFGFLLIAEHSNAYGSHQKQFIRNRPIAQWRTTQVPATTRTPFTPRAPLTTRAPSTTQAPSTTRAPLTTQPPIIIDHQEDEYQPDTRIDDRFALDLFAVSIFMNGIWTVVIMKL